MAALKNSLAKSLLPASDSRRQCTEGSESGPKNLSTSAKYRLRVTAGPSYDTATHRIVLVNSNEATSLENDFVRVKLKVRVKDYTGL